MTAHFFRLRNVKIQNIVGNVDLRLGTRVLNLERFHADHSIFSTYQRNMFPGLIYRPDDSPVVLLIVGQDRHHGRQVGVRRRGRLAGALARGAALHLRARVARRGKGAPRLPPRDLEVERRGALARQRRRRQRRRRQRLRLEQAVQRARRRAVRIDARTNQAGLLQNLRHQLAAEGVPRARHDARPQQARRHLQRAEKQALAVHMLGVAGSERVLHVATREPQTHMVGRIKRASAQCDRAAHVDGARTVVRKLQLDVAKGPMLATSLLIIPSESDAGS